MDRFVGLPVATGFPAPEGLARAVAAPELRGGVLPLLKLVTRPVAALLAAEMGVAILRVLWPRGYLGASSSTRSCCCVPSPWWWREEAPGPWGPDRCRARRRSAQTASHFRTLPIAPGRCGY